MRCGGRGLPSATGADASARVEEAAQVAIEGWACGRCKARRECRRHTAQRPPVNAAAQPARLWHRPDRRREIEIRAARAGSTSRSSSRIRVQSDLTANARKAHEYGVRNCNQTLLCRDAAKLLCFGLGRKAI